MSSLTTNSSSSSAEVLFPAFLYGEQTPCRRKMKAEAKKWTKAYLAGRGFPEPKLVPIALGTVVFTDRNSTDLVRFGYTFIPNTNKVLINGEAAKAQALHLQWRMYLVNELRFEAKLAEWSDEDQWAFDRSFRTFVCQYAWGAITMATCMSLFNSIESTVPRIEAVLRFWETLDRLKYVDLDTYPVSLSQMLDRYFNGHIATWVDRPSGDVRTDLQRAMEHMRRASTDEVYTRLLRRLRGFVDFDQRLTHRDWLKSPGVIERGLEKKLQVGQRWYDNLTGGQCGEHHGFLVWLERNYGPDSEQFDPAFGKKALT